MPCKDDCKALLFQIALPSAQRLLTKLFFGFAVERGAAVTVGSEP